jgi:hypothetical protein
MQGSGAIRTAANIPDVLAMRPEGAQGRPTRCEEAEKGRRRLGVELPT